MSEVENKTDNGWVTPSSASKIIRLIHYTLRTCLRLRWQAVFCEIFDTWSYTDILLSFNQHENTKYSNFSQSLVGTVIKSAFNITRVFIGRILELDSILCKSNRHNVRIYCKQNYKIYSRITGRDESLFVLDWIQWAIDILTYKKIIREEAGGNKNYP